MNKLKGWTRWRVARESGVPASIIHMWESGRLVGPWSDWRIRQTLNWLGFHNTVGGK